MEDARRILLSLTPAPTPHQQHMLLLPCSIDFQLTQHSSTDFTGVSVFPFLWHVNFAYFVAQEMASAETGVLYPCLLPKFKFLSRHITNESWSLIFWINDLTTVLLFKAGHQCCNVIHQLVRSCYAAVHAEPSTVCAYQECSARTPTEMRKDCLASDLVGSQMQMQRLMWAENVLVTNECRRLKRERRNFTIIS